MWRRWLPIHIAGAFPPFLPYDANICGPTNISRPANYDLLTPILVAILALPSTTVNYRLTSDAVARLTWCHYSNIYFLIPTFWPTHSPMTINPIIHYHCYIWYLLPANQHCHCYACGYVVVATLHYDPYHYDSQPAWPLVTPLFGCSLSWR